MVVMWFFIELWCFSPNPPGVQAISAHRYHQYYLPWEALYAGTCLCQAPQPSVEDICSMPAWLSIKAWSLTEEISTWQGIKLWTHHCLLLIRISGRTTFMENFLKERKFIPSSNMVLSIAGVGQTTKESLIPLAWFWPPPHLTRLLRLNWHFFQPFTIGFHQEVLKRKDCKTLYWLYLLWGCWNTLLIIFHM